MSRRRDEEMAARKSRGTQSASPVEKLIEQRRLIEEWLAKLAAGGSEGMPAHVIERVRNDYTARLTAVTKELGDHADGVRQNLETARDRHTALEKEQGARKDELAELRLRRQVGEIDEGRFKDQQQKLRTTLDELGKDLAGALRDIDRLEEILDNLDRAEEPAAPVPEAEPAAAAAPPPPAPPPAPPAPQPEPTAAKAEPVAKVAPAAKEEPAAKEAAKPAKDEDEMSFLRSVTGVVEKVTPPGKPAEPPGKPAAAPATKQEASPPPPESGGEKPFYVLEQMPEKSKDRPSLSQKAPAEGERTITCGECGAKNLPTEWYCEKCGAELTNF